MKKKLKGNEPSLVDELSKPLRGFVEDFKEHGNDALRTVRERNPEKYLELSTKLLPLVAALNPASNDITESRSHEDLGRALLRSVGVSDDDMDADAIAAAIEVRDRKFATAS